MGWDLNFQRFLGRSDPLPRKNLAPSYLSKIGLAYFWSISPMQSVSTMTSAPSHARAFVLQERTLSYRPENLSCEQDSRCDMLSLSRTTTLTRSGLDR
jgi:hypothetical protein